jgi:hypothetical protein
MASAAIANAAPSVTAVSANDFLDTIGANSAIYRRGEELDKTAACLAYTGVRWLRAGEGTDTDKLADLRARTGVRFSWGLGSGRADIEDLVRTAKALEAKSPGAIIAIEGVNEPNNWGIEYQGQKGGGRDASASWIPVARCQADLYRAVKSDPVLKRLPVWSFTETGAERDNVGVQFLKIPANAGTLMPDGTRYADYANSPAPTDNKTWDAADVSRACRVDGLYGNFGTTWNKRFVGYSDAQLASLPRVTTETGTTIGGAIDERTQALNQLTLYLDQFKRGWSYTAVYLLRDRVDEAGNQTFGLYRPDYTPRLAGVYLHNMTTILADKPARRATGSLAYTVSDPPATVHDLLLQKGTGEFELVVWDERIGGKSDTVAVNLGGKQRSVAIYDPTVSTEPVRRFADTATVALTLSDHPCIIEIRQ